MYQMRKAALLGCALALLALGPPARSQGLTHEWSQRFGDSEYQYGSVVAVDASGNVVVTGQFEGTVDFGGGPLASAGSHDIFVAKFDADGNHMWSHSFGDSNLQVGYSVATDLSGNVIATGWFFGTVDFGGGPLTSADQDDIFIAKFDANGNHVWSQRFGDIYSQFARSITADASGNVIVTGGFLDTVDFGGGPLTSSGGFDMFLAKFDAGGRHVWSQRFGDLDYPHAWKVTADASGNVIVTGFFEGTVDLGGGPLTSAGEYDVFVAKYDAGGGHVWSQRFGDSDKQRGLGVATNSSGDVIVAGYFAGTVDFGGGPLTSAGIDDIFVARFDAGGNHVWSQRFGGSDWERCYSVATDASGSVIVTGHFPGVIDFGGGPLTSAGSWDIYVAKFDAGGTHLWSQRFGDWNSQQSRSVTTDASGNVILMGEFYGTVDFGGGPLMSAGDRDIFVAKFLAEAEPITLALDIKPTSCPNPLDVKVFQKLPKNAKSKKGGLLSVAVLGTEGLDVTDIDASTLLLEGVVPLRYDYEDVTAPVENGDECECTTVGPDGYMDLTLKFEKWEIVVALGSVSHADEVPLTLTGELLDGTPFEAIDCVEIIGLEVETPIPLYLEDDEVKLRSPIPNPFNPITRISYVLPREGFVRLSVYDVAGQLACQLVAEVQAAGEHVVEWNASKHASGIYFYRLAAGKQTLTKKMVLLK